MMANGFPMNGSRNLPPMAPKRHRERSAFASRLIFARTQAKLSQTQLAKLAGISQSTLGELETVADGSAYTPQLAEACRVRAVWLATGAEPMRDLSSMLSKECAQLALSIDALPKGERDRAILLCRQIIDLAGGSAAAAVNH